MPATQGLIATSSNAPGADCGVLGTLQAVADPYLYVAAGLLVGLMVGLTGVGGGSLMTPLLVLIFGQPPAVAVGTDLWFAAITKVAATASFGYSRRVDWRIVGRLAWGSIPGAALAIIGFAATYSAAAVDHLILRALAVMLVITAAGMFLHRPLRHLGLRLAASHGRLERRQLLLTVIAGLLIGLAVALTSVGAGALGTVALIWLYPLRLPPDRLVATDIAHALPVTVIAGIGHAALGHLNLPVLACLLIGSIPGILIASRVVIRLPPAITRTLIAAMLLVAAARVLFTS
jgi:uncharacterized protein